MTDTKNPTGLVPKARGNDALRDATLGLPAMAGRSNLADGSTALLLDASGSMRDRVSTNGPNKIAQLVALTREICVQVGDEFPCYVFGTECHRIAPAFVKEETLGMTNLGEAMRDVYAAGQRKLVLITDGHPSDANVALQMAKEFEDIEIIYVGPPPPPEFLADLAAMFNHPLHNNDLGAIKEIEQKVVALLGPGRKAISDGGPIEL
jgi:hypothetical protein